LWDRLVEVGRPFGVTAAGMLALDMSRLEAGLILIEVDYTSAKHALVHDQSYSPFEIGLGRLVNFDKATDFVGRQALKAEVEAAVRRGGWSGWISTGTASSGCYEAQDLPIWVSAVTWRAHVPVYAGGRQIGRATSGTFSPTLKKHIALASVDAAFEPAGSQSSSSGAWRVGGESCGDSQPTSLLRSPRKRA
jgi:aminomethyltransferase